MTNGHDQDIRPTICRIEPGGVQAGSSGEALMLLFGLEGRCQIDLDSGCYPCGHGDVVLLPPKTVYRLGAGEELGRAAVWSLAPEQLVRAQHRGCQAAEQILELADRGMTLPLSEKEQERIRLLLDGGAEDRHGSYYRMNAMELVLIELCRVIEGREDVQERMSRSETERSRLIKNVITYVNEHYREEIRLDSIARQFWVSPSYLSRQFKSKVGVSITRFITERRLQAAQRLLMTSDLDIAEIADQLGFKSANYFYTVFKKNQGISPREFRKNSRISDKLLDHHWEMGG